MASERIHLDSRVLFQFAGPVRDPRDSRESSPRDPATEPQESGDYAPCGIRPRGNRWISRARGAVRDLAGSIRSKSRSGP